MTTLQALTVVTISAAVLFGMILALLGSLKLALARRLNLGEGRVGGLITALNLALIPMMVVCGLLVDVLGIRFILILGSVFTAISLFSIGMSPTYRRALFSAFGAGLGAAALCSGAVVLMPHAFFDRGSSLSPHVTPALSLGHVFIALGALMTPALVDVLLGWLSFRRTLALLGGLALIPGLLCLIPPFSEHLNELQTGAAFPMTDNPNVGHLGLAALVFFFYAPLEAAVVVWTTKYLSENGSSETQAAYLLSGFWACFLIARLLMAFFQPGPAYDPWVLALLALCAAAMLGNLASTASYTISRTGILALGFFLGPVFPLLLGIVFREFPHERGTALGVVYAVGSAASLLIGPIMGSRLQKGSHAVFGIPLMLSLGLLLATVLFALNLMRQN